MEMTAFFVGRLKFSADGTRITTAITVKAQRIQLKISLFMKTLTLNTYHLFSVQFCGFDEKQSRNSNPQIQTLRYVPAANQLFSFFTI